MTNDDLGRIDLASAHVADERVAALAELFPEVMREGKVDFDALQRSVGDWVDPGSETFGLTWPGKAECMRVIQEPSIGTLVPLPDESVAWDATQNVIIEGENLEVLKLLQAGLPEMVGIHRSQKVVVTRKNERQTPKRSCYYATL